MSSEFIPGFAISLTICMLIALFAMFGRIVRRAGYSRAWALTMLVPGLNILMLWFFAFAVWPVTLPRGGRG
jgi:hypothetical protein